MDADDRPSRRLDMYAEPSFSLEGEDMLLKVALGFEGGFYLDVGACHPRLHSNTAYFHTRGWRGINIDANPDAIAAFEAERPDDINVCSGVGDESGSFDFFRFKESALNTFDAKRAAMLATENPERRTPEVLSVDVQPLHAILDRYLPEGQGIDLMNVDLEGWDLAALRSNDWERFRPHYLMVEVFERDIAKLPSDPIYAFVAAQDYKCIAKALGTAIFEDERGASYSQ